MRKFLRTTVNRWRGQVRFLVVFLWTLILINGTFSENYFRGESSTVHEDFVAMAKVLKEPELLSEGLLGKVAQAMDGLNAWIELSQLAWDWGIAPQAQYRIAYFILSVLASAGIASVLGAFSLPVLLQLVGSAACVLSTFASFGRYLSLSFYVKAVASTISVGIGLIVLGLFLRGYYRVAVTLGAASIYLHPTHSAIMVALVLGYLALRRRVPATPTPPRGDFAQAVGIAAVITGPYVVMLLLNQPSSAGVDWDLWRRFFVAKTSNVFPLGDGLPLVMCLIGAILAGIAIWQVSASSRGDAQWREIAVRASWWLGGVLVLLVIQIVFADLMATKLVTQAALTRAMPYAGVLLIAGVLVAAWERLKDADRGRTSALAWGLLILAFAPGRALHDGLPLEGIYREVLHPALVKNFDPMLIAVVAASLILYSHRDSLPRMRQTAMDLMLLLAGGLAVFGIAAFGGRWSYYFALASLAVTAVGKRRDPRLSFQVRPFLRVVVIVSLLLMSYNARMSNGWRAIDAAWNGDMSPEARTRAEVVSMLERHVPRSAVVVHIPHGDEVGEIVAPVRASFIGRAEVQYALYVPSLINEVMRRLPLVGVDIERDVYGSPRCAGLRALLVYMCRRTLYYQASWEDNGLWRRQIGAMKQEAPRLGYALVLRRFACLEDRPIAQGGGYLLIPLDRIAGPTCTRLK